MIRVAYRVASILILLLILVAPATAVTADVGETFIRWQWGTSYSSDAMIFVDGINQSSAQGRQMFYAGDLQPNEIHQISIVNATSGEVLESGQVKTLFPLGIILFFVGIMVVLAILCIALQEPIRVILTGALGSALGTYVFGLSLGHGALWVVVLGLIGFMGIFVILWLYKLLEEKLNWW